MLFIKAFHIIAMVAWFAGLFYLPRLFVYHSETQDPTSKKRFQTMEKRLYYSITWPAAIITTVLGFWLLTYNMSYYIQAPWMHTKLTLVALLWVFHVYCGYFVKRFQQEKNDKNAAFFRLFNEIPTILLIAIVLLVVVRPF